MKIKRIKFQNYTVFEDQQMEFSPGINVIIGENGTGKTHLMKDYHEDMIFMYAWNEWAEGGYLLLVSMRAHDESEGEFSTLGVIEQYDCKAWANWAVERFGEEKSVFFMGVSTGASIAMMSSNLGLPKSVRGIIDDCGFTSTMEMIDVNCKSHLPDYIPTRMFDFFVEMGTSVWGHFCISKADACKAVSQTDIPILIIHGDRDTQAPLSMAYRLYDSCSSEKQLYVVHGANHAENYRKNPEGYENVIAQFVEEHSGALKKEY